MEGAGSRMHKVVGSDSSLSQASHPDLVGEFEPDLRKQ